MNARNLSLCFAMLTVLVGGCSVRGGPTSATTDPAGELIAVALKAHEAATGETKPARIVLEPWGLDHAGMPPEVAEGVRRRIADGEDGAPVASQDARNQPAAWTLYFDANPREPDVVYVGVMTGVRPPPMAGVRDHPWRVYAISVTRTADRLRIGEVFWTGTAFR